MAIFPDLMLENSTVKQGILFLCHFIYRKASRIPADRVSDAMINMSPPVTSVDFPPFFHVLILTVVEIVA